MLKEESMTFSLSWTVCLPLVAIILNWLAIRAIGSDYSVSALTNLCLTMADGTKDYAPWALFVILLVVAVLAFGTIFLFKKRMLQIRLTIFSTILLIGYYATLVTFIFMLKEESMTFSPSWTVCLPLVAIILNWLAIRAIGKDEVLVKAYDRLR
jgi:hypothetical protein